MVHHPQPPPSERIEPEHDDRVYRTTQLAISEFEVTLAQLEADPKDSPDWIRKSMREAILSQLEDLRAELAELEARHSRRG